jgi:hypothetical protein
VPERVQWFQRWNTRTKKWRDWRKRRHVFLWCLLWYGKASMRNLCDSGTSITCSEVSYVMEFLVRKVITYHEVKACTEVLSVVVCRFRHCRTAFDYIQIQWIGCGLDDRRIDLGIREAARDISVVHIFQTDFGCPPSLLSNGYRDPIPWSKGIREWMFPVASISYRAVPPFPITLDGVVLN